MRRALAVLLASALPVAAADRLPALGAGADGLTVSGLSSGGYMAVQVHVAHSARVKGAGAIAAGPYYCAQGSLWNAYYACLNPSASAPLPQTAALVREGQGLEQGKRIDATSHLAGSKAWIFSGREDRTVVPEVVRALRDFYAHYKADAALVDDKPAGHAIVTEDQGNACASTAAPYINDCDYDAAGALLRHLLGAPPAAAPARAGGRLLRFDQREFAAGNALALSLADEGYAYIPKACEAERCRVHVAFHGCRQGASEVGERFVRDAGYNRWADAHKLVVLYPQAAQRSGFGFGTWNFVWNPRGCWDWWGYTGAAYHTKEGAQVRAVMAMVERATAARK